MMKHVKTLALAAVASAALMVLGGAATASATTLTGEGGAVLEAGSSIQAIRESITRLTTAYKNIECGTSTIAAKTTNETGTTVNANLESLILEECNCEVKVLSKGTLSIAWTSGNNGTVSSSGIELTTSCSTMFGTVHCVYATSNTALGTLVGGFTATLSISNANIPYLSTNPLCGAENPRLDATYGFYNPTTLKVIP